MAKEEISIEIDPKSKLAAIPGTNCMMGVTQVTQRLYKKVMGWNPSWFQRSNDDLDDDEKNALKNDTADNPVEQVSWFDAVYFCNKLSMAEGLDPAYSVDGETDPGYWATRRTKTKALTPMWNATLTQTATGFPQTMSGKRPRTEARNVHILEATTWTRLVGMTAIATM